MGQVPHNCITLLWNLPFQPSVTKVNHGVTRGMTHPAMADLLQVSLNERQEHKAFWLWRWAGQEGIEVGVDGERRGGMGWGLLNPLRNPPSGSDTPRSVQRSVFANS